MPDRYPSLHQTVRVGADGTVTHGVSVPHRAANIARGTDNRVVAVAPRKAAGSLRFAPDRIPGNPREQRAIEAVTAPHDCRNHITAFEDEPAREARVALDAPLREEVAA